MTSRRTFWNGWHHSGTPLSPSFCAHREVLSCKKTDKLLGVHIINAIAGDIISGACIGIEYGAASEEPKGQFRDRSDQES